MPGRWQVKFSCPKCKLKHEGRYAGLVNCESCGASLNINCGKVPATPDSAARGGVRPDRRTSSSEQPAAAGSCPPAGSKPAPPNGTSSGSPDKPIDLTENDRSNDTPSGSGAGQASPRVPASNKRKSPTDGGASRSSKRQQMSPTGKKQVTLDKLWARPKANHKPACAESDPDFV